MIIKQNFNCSRQIVKYVSRCKEEYPILLQNVITSRYKKTDKHIATNIRKEGFKHAR